MYSRYSRQIILPEIGQEGQRKLQESSVLCIGAGGLGSPALLYLAAAGVGRIGIVDDDIVDITNLQRQVIFKEGDQGEAKVEAASRAIKSLNSTIIIETFQERFSANNAQSLLSSYDLVIDGTDNFTSKFLINDACAKFNKPFIYGSILGFEAQVSVFWTQFGPCYRCLHPKPPSGYIPNCAEAGVIGAVAGLAGTIQAFEAIKMLLGLKWCESKGITPLLGVLWLLDAKTMESRRLVVPKNPSCLCNNHTTIILQESDNSCKVGASIKNLSPIQAMEIINESIFIDVREDRELAYGVIPGAKHIPLGRLLTDLSLICDLPKNVQIVVYCQHGIRSLAGAKYLQNNGYKNISHLAGGIVQWQGDLCYL